MNKNIQNNHKTIKTIATTTCGAAFRSYIGCAPLVLVPSLLRHCHRIFGTRCHINKYTKQPHAMNTTDKLASIPKQTWWWNKRMGEPLAPWLQAVVGKDGCCLFFFCNHIVSVSDHGYQQWAGDMHTNERFLHGMTRVEKCKRMSGSMA